MSPARRLRLRRTGGAGFLVVAFLMGLSFRASTWDVTVALFFGFMLFALFQAYLLWCLDTLNKECHEANEIRNLAVIERDMAYASRDQIWEEAQGLIRTSEQIVENSRALMAQRAARHGLIAGEPSVVAQVVAEAKQRGVDVEYVTLDDLDALS